MTFSGAILFPGQGSQEKNMGRDLAEYWPEAMELWKLGEKISNLPLREVYWDGNEQEQSQTLYVQPALTIVNLSFFYFLKNKLSPVALAGHSLGEFSALAASKVISIEDTLKLVSIRGRLMQEATSDTPGSMVAILKLPLEQLEEIVKKLQNKGIILIANYNTPLQYVVSGEESLIEELIEESKNFKCRAIKLNVNGAFHSPLMQEAARELEKEIDKIEFRTPEYPIFCNVSSLKEINSLNIKDNLKKQMVSSVLWYQSIENMFKENITSYLELGPKGVLSKMISQIISHPELKVQKISTLEETKILGEEN
ncbi:MAG: [acyl-carrier-protein] S-malonyltransferase [Desulfonauticus sp.]|jgi:[acyl-carrier-protein] S-malonyltransferase|nr:MAG: Malonyl CoA-acyl carrier protein transacylase [Desulfonauticus sp. 38_4375]MDK2921984.1 [acyl-carrier-protein] S-malonyltransferase [Desulfonauticus sp.]